MDALATLTQTALEIAKPEHSGTANFLVRLTAYMAAAGIGLRSISGVELQLLVEDRETWRRAASALRRPDADGLDWEPSRAF